MNPYVAWIGPAVLSLSLLNMSSVQAYPLDGGKSTGIRRLQITLDAQAHKPSLPKGALLPLESVRISGISAEPLPPADPQLSASIREALGTMAPDYGVALVDLTDPRDIRYGAHQPDYLANVGSVGKMLVLLAWFQKLADLYPQDIEARATILHKTMVVADDYIVYDEHKVPIIQDGSSQLVSRRLRQGDSGNLWEWLDWTISASSNAAGAVVMKELVALQLMGHDYTPNQTTRNALLADTSPAARGKALRKVLLTPLSRNGLNPAKIRQGSLFTRTGKAQIPGTSSYATPHELVRLLTLIEAGRFVDTWSSTEAKRLLYMTQRRIRYASHPVLNPAAVYFKSGSLYSCIEEAGFSCRKYMGNKVNRLASVALVEYPAEAPVLRYAVAVMSNVLRVNSAVAHQTLAMRLHRIIEARHMARPATDIKTAAGKSDEG